MTNEQCAQLLTNARQLFEKGSWGDAEREFKAALESSKQANGKGNGAASNVTTIQRAEIALDLAELLVLKERKTDSKTLCEETIELLEAEQSPCDQTRRLLIKAYTTYVDVLSLSDEFDDAEPVILKALKTADTEEHRRNGKYAQILATQGAMKLTQELFEEAEALLQEALSIAEEHGLKKGEEFSSILSIDALRLHLAGDLAASEELFRKSLEAVADEKYSRAFADVCFGYTTLLVSQSRFAEAIELLQTEIKNREKELGNDHPLLKRAIGALAVANASYGDLEEAEIQAQRYNLLVEMMGDAGSELKIDCLRTLIDILVDQSRYSEAEVLLTRANDIVQNLKNDYVKANLISDVARLKVELGDYEEAEQLCRHAVELTRANKGDDHIETAMCLSILGSAYFSNRKMDLAESTYREAIRLIERHDHFFTTFVGAENCRYLGMILTLKGEFNEAEELFLKILAIHAKSNGPPSVQAAETHRNLGELFEAQEKNVEALMQYEQALKIARSIFGEGNPEISDYLSYVADINRKQNNFESAKKYYSDAKAILDATVGPSHPKSCLLLQRIGEMAIEQSDYATAEAHFKQALTGLQQTVGSNHPDIGYTYWCLGAAYHWQEKFKDAAKCYREALNIKEQQLGHKHEDLLNIIEPLIEVSRKLRRIDEVDQLNNWLNEITSYKKPG